MKRRMRKVTALVLSVGMMLSMTITSGAVTIDEAQKKADELQSQKSAAQAEKDTLAAKLNSIIDQMNKTQEELSAKETEISTAEEELVQAKVDEDDQYNSMKNWINFMREYSVDYIWNYKLQFGDWVALDAEEGSYFGATPNDLTCTAYYAYSTGLFVKMAKALGKDDVAAEYEELYSKIVKKFQDTFFDAEGNMTAQTQTAHIVALYFQLTPEKYIEKTVEGLKKLLAKENGHLVTGFVGTLRISAMR